MRTICAGLLTCQKTVIAAARTLQYLAMLATALLSATLVRGANGNAVAGAGVDMHTGGEVARG